MISWYVRILNSNKASCSYFKILKLFKFWTREKEGKKIVEKVEETEEQEQVVTKEIYEVMTDKEKAEWIGIDSNDMLASIKQFHEKLKSIGITYQYISDETEDYCRLEEAIKKNSEPSWHYHNKRR